MRRRVVGLLVLCTLLGPAVAVTTAADATATGTTTAGGASEAGPSIEATVDGAPLGGERVVVTTDPSLVIAVTADRPVRTVSVRVDGAVVRSFSPDAAEVSRTIPLDLDHGTHRVEVVADAGDGRGTNLVGTVVEDAAAPRVTYTSPFSSSPVTGPPATVRVDGPSVRLAGDLSDASRVTSVSITHTYTYTYAGARQRYRRSYSIRDPGASFSQRLFLGLGENRVRVRVRDETGQGRSQEFTLELRDTDPPTVRFDRVERVADGSAVRIAGVVSDDVKVASVAVTRGYGNSERYLVEPTTREPDPDRRSVRFETTVPVGPRTGQVRVVATDFDGTTVARDLPDEYGRPIVPDVRIGGAEVVDGTVRVHGTVDGGEVERVVVSTTTADGERIALATVHDGSIRRHVSVDRRLGAAADGPTVVRLRAVDATGESHVDTRTVGESATRTPTGRTRTDRATATGTPGSGVPSSLPGTDSPALVAGVAAATLSAVAASLVIVFR